MGTSEISEKAHTAVYSESSKESAQSKFFRSFWECKAKVQNYFLRYRIRRHTGWSSYLSHILNAYNFLSFQPISPIF